MIAPIVLIVYNRPDHARRTVEALLQNPMAADSELYIYADGPKHPGHSEGVRMVREYIHSVSGFKRVHLIEREKNMGLAKSTIAAMSEVVNKHGRAIFLDDDIFTAPGFLTFLNQALDAYEGNPRIYSVSAWTPPIEIPSSYSHDVYLSHRALSWGWATWADRWNLVDWEVKDYEQFMLDKKAQKLFARGGDDLPDMLRHRMTGRVDSWSIRWTYTQFKLGSYSLVSTVPLAENGGFDNTGVHCTSEYDVFGVKLNREKMSFRFPESLDVDPEIAERFRKFYGYNWRAKVKKMLGLL